VAEVCEVRECCRRPDVPAQERPCMTAYHDPKMNTKPVLCDECAQEYHDYWQERWDEYYAGLL